MGVISRRSLGRLLTKVRDADTTAQKGRALEDLVAYLFRRVPGITLTQRDQLNVFQSEEVDLAFWNDKTPSGLPFLPDILLVECKNWSSPVGSAEVSWFDQKLQSRSRTHGILVATNGVTGNAVDANAAHDIIKRALGSGRHLIVITLDEIAPLRTTSELVGLIKRKLCELVVSGTVIL